MKRPGRLKRLFDLLFKLDYLRTLYINCKLFPFRIAIRIPVFIYRGGVDIRHNKRGSIKFSTSIRPGIIRVGAPLDYSVHGTRLWRGGRFSIQGSMTVGGTMLLATGSSFVVDSLGNADIGSDFFFNVGSIFYCFNKINIGNSCSVSWQTQIIDTNLHFIVDKDGLVNRCFGDIEIGNYCWIGNRVTVSQGTKLPNYSIVASNSLINRNYSNEQEKIIFAGIPANPIKGGYRRIYSEDYQELLFDYFSAHPDETVVSLEKVIQE